MLIQSISFDWKTEENFPSSKANEMLLLGPRKHLAIFLLVSLSLTSNYLSCSMTRSSERSFCYYRVMRYSLLYRSFKQFKVLLLPKANFHGVPSILVLFIFIIIWDAEILFQNLEGGTTTKGKERGSYKRPQSKIDIKSIKVSKTFVLLWIKKDET